MTENNVVQPDSDNNHQSADGDQIIDSAGRFYAMVAEAAPQQQQRTDKGRDANHQPRPVGNGKVGFAVDTHQIEQTLWNQKTAGMTRKGQENPSMEKYGAIEQLVFFQEFTGAGVPPVAVGDVAVAVTHHKGGEAQIGKDSEHERIIKVHGSPPAGYALASGGWPRPSTAGHRSIAMVTIGCNKAP